MSDKILFDADGVIGPTITLFLQINSLTNDEVLTIADILVTNFNKLSSKKITVNGFSKDGFNSDEIKMSDIMDTPLFKSMQNEYSVEITQKVLDKITPKTIMYICKYVPHIDFNENQYDELKLWLSKQLQTYMSENQIIETCSVADIDPEYLKRRQEIGMDIYNSEATLEEFDNLIRCLHNLELLENSSNFVVEYFEKYEKLFRDANNSNFSNNVIDLLNTIFRNKKFPGSKSIVFC